MCEPSKIFECHASYPKIGEESFPNVRFFNQIQLESAGTVPVPGNLSAQIGTERTNIGFSYVSFTIAYIPLAP